MSKDDPDRFRDEFTHGLMSSDIQYYEHLSEGEAPGKATSICADHVLRLCKKNNVKFSGRWLDIGCGSGYLLSQVKSLGFIEQGIEPGGWGQIAAEIKGINIFQGFLSRQTFSNRYEVISATDVLEHLPNPIAFLQLIAEYLANTGRVVISIPFSDSIEAKIFGARWNMVEPPTHCQFFTMKSLSIALNQAGMEIVDSKQFNVRNLRGLSCFSPLLNIIDFIFPGPQFVCLAQKTRNQ